MYGERNKLRLNQKKTMGARDLIAHSCVLGFLLVVLSPSVWADGFGGTTIAQPQDEKILDEKFTDPCQTHDGPGDPISPYNGREFLRRTDVLVKGLFPIVIERRYNSQSTYDSPLGYGWALNHDRRLYEYADGSVTLRYRCGRRDRFVFSGDAYVRPNGGQYGELVQNGDGTFTYTYQSGGKDTYDTEGRLVATENPRGNRLEYLYDARGKLPLTGTSPFAVDPNQPMTVAYVHRLIRIEERTADGNLTGNAVDLSYDGTTGRLTAITSNDGRQVIYVHDQTAGLTQGNLVQVNGLENIVSTYEYQDPDDAHNLTSIQEGAGTTPHTNVYDEQDRVITQDYGNRSIQFDYAVDFTKTTVTKTITDDGGNILHTPVTVYHYDSQGYPEKIVDALGNETQFNYNNQGFLVRKEIWEKQGITLTLIQAVDYTYDTAGNTLTETVVLDSGEIATKTWTYDGNQVASEQVASSLDPSKLFRTEFVYNHAADGSPTTLNEIRERKDDGSFQVTSYTYDSLGRRITETLPDSHVIVTEYIGGLFASKVYHQVGGTEIPYLTQRYDYDSHGNRSKILDARNNLTEYIFSDRGRVTTVVNPRGEEIHLSFVRDKINEIEIGRTSIDGEGQVTRYNYDAADRLISIERKDPTNNFTTLRVFTYDSDGNRLSATDAQVRTTNFTYDVLGRLSSIVDPLNQTTSFEYDAVGNRTSIRDALGRNVAYRFDDLNRLIEQERFDVGETVKLGYDASGNTTSVIDPKLNATTYEYDALSQLTRVIQALNQELRYSYDARGRVSSVINARGQREAITYEPWGPVKSIQYFASSSATVAERTLDYSRDFDGNVETVVDDTIQVGLLYSITYDALSRPEVVNLDYLPGAVKKLIYSYDRFGNRNQLVLDDGAVSTHDYTFNKAGQLIAAMLPGGQGFVIEPDDNDDITSITHPSGVVTNFNYQLNGPIQSISINGSGGAIEQLTYTHDAVLNVDTLSDNDGLHSYDYDGVGRLMEVLHPPASGLPSTESFAYDGAGNREDPSNSSLYDYDANNRIVQSPGLTYLYDDDGNLTSRSDGANFVYDHVGRLSQYLIGSTMAQYVYDPFGRRIKKTVDGAVTWYVWAGRQLIAEYDDIGARTRRYAYLANAPVPIQMEDQNGIYDIHSDHLEVPRFLTDASQNVVWRAKYESFGNALVDNDVDNNGVAVMFNFRLPGQYYDAETGLHYNRFRYYSPDIGRYIRPDPIGQAGGLNLYAYVENDPINRDDPLGLVTGDDVFKVLAKIASLPKLAIEYLLVALCKEVRKSVDRFDDSLGAEDDLERELKKAEEAFELGVKSCLFFECPREFTECYQKEIDERDRRVQDAFEWYDEARKNHQTRRFREIVLDTVCPEP